MFFFVFYQVLHFYFLFSSEALLSCIENGVQRVCRSGGVVGVNQMFDVALYRNSPPTHCTLYTTHGVQQVHGTLVL